MQKKPIPVSEFEDKIRSLCAEMTVEEKATLLHGKDTWTTNPIPRLNIPSFGMTDGPLGVGWHSSGFSKCTRFPATIGLAATWNRDLAYQMGEVIGKETKSVGRHQILAPGINILRSPLGGRTFEYLSEDPILSSEMAIPFVKGTQDQGTATCIKHYVTNNSETQRMKISTEISERALFEIYIRNFKRVVEQSDPWGAMACYNKVNGVHGAENKYILKDILRDQLGFTGFVVSDWFAANGTTSTAATIKGGLSLEMPSLSRKLKLKKVMKAYENKEFTEEELDELIRPMLRTFYRVGLFEDPGTPQKKKINDSEHQKVAQQIAEESMVLLKNDLTTLPIDISKVKSIAILGPNAKRKFGKPMQGGSSAAVPPIFITPYQGIANKVKGKIKIANKPEEADLTILIVGLTHSFFKEADTEGRDRTILELPEKQEKLILETVAKNPNTIVIVVAGSPIAMDNWMDKVPAILYAWYPNMMGGNALANILFGDINPSGKLPITFPKTLADHPAHQSERSFPGDIENLKIYYDDEIWVGYRGFEKKGIEPLFPFGFGLSYTQFEYGNAAISQETGTLGDKLEVSIEIKNIGKIPGKEIVQVYSSDLECPVERPKKELVGFGKVVLQPNESKVLKIAIDTKDLCYYNDQEHKFMVEPGEFEFSIGSSSSKIHQKVLFTLK